MSFPYHDPFWCETAEFLEARVRDGDAILAPDIFWWRFRKIYRYINTRLRPDFQYDWVVLHKGLLHELSAAFVRNATEVLDPVFANEVFVILARQTTLAALAPDHPHLASLTEQLPSLTARAGDDSATEAAQSILPDPGTIYKFSLLEPRELEQAMDEFWLHGGYKYTTLRDKTYYAEIDRHIKEFIGDGRGKTILDLACGIGRLGKLMSPESRVVGVDVSSIAIGMAKERHQAKPNFTFEQMDAHDLSFPDRSFDMVLLIDAIEHVMDADRVFSEIARVLRLDGLMLVTVANRDSVNQILTRKLGNPEFVTNYQHVREFSYAETLALLDRHGFNLDRTAGIFLYPYWGVPGVDEIVRQVTDDDPEFVELMNLLGERVGAEHAYCSVVLARKRASQAL